MSYIYKTGIRFKKKSIIIDAHTDIPTQIFVKRNEGERNVLDNLHADRLCKGGINLQVLAIYVEARYKPRRSLEMALRQLEALLDDISESSEFMLIKNKKDLDSAIEQKKIGAILSMEGAEPIEAGIELLHLFFRLGIRILGFTWNQRNKLADGVDEIVSGGGLTSYGRVVLKEAFRLNILPDISHMAPAGVSDVIELATGPVIASHSGARSIYDYPRNLSDEQIVKIAKTGGVIGVPAISVLIGPPGLPIPTVETVVDHIEHLVRVAGENHVGFGADFIDYLAELDSMGRIGNEWDINSQEKETQGLYTASDIPNLREAMNKRNFSNKLINKVLGENFLRVFYESLPIN